MRIVIRAGGVGSRLWPWSRSDRPKQFLRLFSGSSSTRIAWQRFKTSGLAPEDGIFLSVGKDSLDLALEELPDFPAERIIVEPARRDTAAAIGLETIWVTQRCGNDVIASIGSDHYVEKPNEFIRALRTAERFARERPDYLVAIACEPTRVETNYGHIKRGQALAHYEETNVYQVDKFTEKPDFRLAQEYAESDDYLWNANFFVWPSQTLMKKFEQYEPEMHKILLQLKDRMQEGSSRDAVRAIYPGLKKTSIDYAVLEPAARDGKMAVVPVSMGWSDIGSWATLTDAFPPDENGNLLFGPVLDHETKDTIIFVRNPDRRVVATIGVEGLAIIDTNDALLIVPKEQCGKVKRLVEQMRESEQWQDLV